MPYSEIKRLKMSLLFVTNEMQTDCTVSEYLSDNQDMQNYFRQASVNLKDILKNPGVWDPFILSYVEVSTHSPLPELIKEIYIFYITR